MTENMFRLQNYLIIFVLFSVTILSFKAHAGEENMKKVLVVIGSEKGSTLEIGDRIKTVLRRVNRKFKDIDD